MKRLKALSILRIIVISILHIMPFQRRSQSLASFHSSIPQRLSKNRLFTTCAVKSDFSQFRRRQKKDDPLFEIIVDEALDESEIKKNTDFNFNIFFIQFRHNTERTIFIHKRNDDKR